MGVDAFPNSVLGVGCPDGLPWGLGPYLDSILSSSACPAQPASPHSLWMPVAPLLLSFCRASLPPVPLTLLASSEEEVLLIV